MAASAAERAAEDARRAAAVVGVHPGHGAAGHAAADGAVALPAPAVSAGPGSDAIDADARDVARRVLDAAAAAPRSAPADRGGEGSAGKTGGGGPQPRIASSSARTCTRWRRCCATSSCCRPGRIRRAGQRRRAARARPAHEGVSAASAAMTRVSAPSIGRWWRWTATPASRSWPTGWCCSCDGPACLRATADWRLLTADC